jgi:hypothetical protein
LFCRATGFVSSMNRSARFVVEVLFKARATTLKIRSAKNAEEISEVERRSEECSTDDYAFLTITVSEAVTVLVRRAEKR